MIKKSTGLWWMIGLLGVLALSCTFSQTLRQGTRTEGPASPTTPRAEAAATETQVPTPTVVPSPTSTPQPTEPPPNLEVSQVFLRYDSQEPEGTFEATLCNVGPYPFEGALEVTFEVNGVTSTVRLPGEQEWRVGQCRDVHADKGFSFFGITQPGEVEVTVRFGVADGAPSAFQAHQERMTIRYLATGPTEEARQRYQECMERFGQYLSDKNVCADRLPDFPLAKRDEIAKRWGVFTVIGPRDKEDLLAPWLLILRTCTPAVQRFLALPQDFEVPFLVVRFDYEHRVLAWTTGASIFFWGDSRDNGALTEMSREGCRPGRVNSSDAPMLIHEIVHALVSLYVDDEWHGYFYDTVLDDGTVLKGEHIEYVNSLPYVLNEGLAYWTAAQFNAEPQFFDWECAPGGLVDRHTQEKLDYMPLELIFVEERDQWMQEHLPNGSMPEAFQGVVDPGYFWHMASGQCFWDWLASMEGRETIGKVLTQMRISGRKTTCEYPFVDVALAPVVREETLRLLERLFGVRRGVSACTYGGY